MWHFYFLNQTFKVVNGMKFLDKSIKRPNVYRSMHVFYTGNLRSWKSTLIMTIWDEFLTAKSTFRWIKPKKVKILHLLTIKLCYFWQSLSSFKTLIKTTEHRQSLHNTFSNICGTNDKFFWSLPCSKRWYNK